MAQPAGHRQFVEAQGDGGRLEACGQVDGGVEANADGNRKGLAQAFGLGAELVDVAAGNEVDAEGIGALHAQPVNGDVGGAGFGVARSDQSHGDVRPGIALSVGGGGNQAAQVEGRTDDHFLAGGSFDGHRWPRVIERFEEVEGQPLDGAAHEQGGTLAAGQDSNDDWNGEALDVFEEQGGAGCGAPVDGGEFRVGVDGLARGGELAGDGGEELQRGAEIENATSIHW